MCFGRDGFRSMVLDALACINMYCNIERNIMKNQADSPGFGIQWEISVYMCFICYALAFLFFPVIENSYAGNFYTGLKTYILLISIVFINKCAKNAILSFQSLSHCLFQFP